MTYRPRCRTCGLDAEELCVCDWHDHHWDGRITECGDPECECSGREREEQSW